MTNAWDAAKEASDNIQTGSYVSLKNDKDKVVGIFLGDPAVVNTYYNEDTKQSGRTPTSTAKTGRRSTRSSSSTSSSSTLAWETRPFKKAS